MKSLIKVGVVAASLSLIAAFASAAGPVTGTWRGHVKVDVTKIHQPRTADEKSKMVAHINKLQKSTTTLVLKPDHTFAIGVDNDKSVPTLTGTWKQNGNSLVLAGKGNGRMGPTNQTLTLSTDGKTMSTTFAGAQFTFHR